MAAETPVTCEYCSNEYTTAGGLTRHLSRCPVRLAQHEVQLAAAQAPVVIAQTNIMIIQYTQQTIAAEIPLFDSFLARMLTVVGEQAAAWRGGSDTACAKIREIKAAVESSDDPNCKQIGVWLASRDVEREMANGVDDEAIMSHTLANVNCVEETVLNLIKSYMPDAEKARFEAAFEEAGSLFAL